ncbi:MAG: hypothetical protein HEP71_05055 [Roseivirga sp.]|nr:hypothetical protein [Roseivirga sp.]
MLLKSTFLSIWLLLFFSASLIAQTEKPPCTGGSYDLVTPYLGTWHEYRVTDSTEVFLGTLITELQVKGCAIRQSFARQDSSFTYQSLGYVNPSSGLWHENYVFSNGGTATFQWVTEGENLYTLRIAASRSSDHIYRLQYSPMLNKEYTVTLQRSYDGGKTWESTGTTRIKQVI